MDRTQTQSRQNSEKGLSPFVSNGAGNGRSPGWPGPPAPGPAVAVRPQRSSDRKGPQGPQLAPQHQQLAQGRPPRPVSSGSGAEDRRSHASTPGRPPAERTRSTGPNDAELQAIFRSLDVGRCGRVNQGEFMSALHARLSRQSQVDGQLHPMEIALQRMLAQGERDISWEEFAQVARQCKQAAGQAAGGQAAGHGEIQVLQVDGSTVARCRLTDTAGDVLQRIRAQARIPEATRVQLVFGQHIFHSWEVLGDLGVRSGDTVTLVKRDPVAVPPLVMPQQTWASGGSGHHGGHAGGHAGQPPGGHHGGGRAGGRARGRDGQEAQDTATSDTDSWEADYAARDGPGGREEDACCVLA